MAGVWQRTSKHGGGEVAECPDPKAAGRERESSLAWVFETTKPTPISRPPLRPHLLIFLLIFPKQVYELVSKNIQIYDPMEVILIYATIGANKLFLYRKHS